MQNDQAIKRDAGKIRPTLVPRGIIRAISVIRQYGLEKYGNAECWQKVEKERYRDAAYRHWLQYLDDPKGVDHESGLSSLWHCACNIAFLIELEGGLKEYRGSGVHCDRGDNQGTGETNSQGIQAGF